MCCVSIDRLEEGGESAVAMLKHPAIFSLIIISFKISKGGERYTSALNVRYVLKLWKAMADSQESNNVDGAKVPNIPLNSVLQYAIQNTQNDGNMQEAIEAASGRTEAENAWLSQALGSLSTDHVKVIRSNLGIIESELQKSVEDSDTKILEALGSLQDWLEKADFANDFCKMGGLHHLGQLLGRNDEVCAEALELLAMLCENNIPCQSAVQDHGGIFSLLISKIKPENIEDVRVKAVRAISSFVRSNPKGLLKFVSVGGYTTTMKVLKEEDISDRLRHKCAFLLYATSNEWSDTLLESLVMTGLMDALLDISKLEHHQYHEFIMGTVLKIASTSSEGRRLCVSDNDFRILLNNRIEELKSDGAFDEEVEYMKKIVAILQKK